MTSPGASKFVSASSLHHPQTETFGRLPRPTWKAISSLMFSQLFHQWLPCRRMPISIFSNSCVSPTLVKCSRLSKSWLIASWRVPLPRSAATCSNLLCSFQPHCCSGTSWRAAGLHWGRRVMAGSRWCKSHLWVRAAMLNLRNMNLNKSTSSPSIGFSRFWQRSVTVTMLVKTAPNSSSVFPSSSAVWPSLPC